VTFASVRPGSSIGLRQVAIAVVGEAAPVRVLAERELEDAGFTVENYSQSSEPELILLLLHDATDAQRTREVGMMRQAHPEACVVAVMPAGGTNASLRRVLLAGATGIVLDDDLEHALVPTACAALAGQLAVPVALARHIAPRPLSHREKQILALVMRGLTNHEIARKLYLAESTVKTHLSSAFRKLDARSRSEAVTRMIDPEGGYRATILDIADELTRGAA
jgi:DNA-binding NarL/FixJ family response regulator